jgi:hypothetical protein
LPSTKDSTVTDLDPSGDIPVTIVPSEPTAAGCDLPLATSPALAPPNAEAAAAASGRTRTVVVIVRLPSRWV